VIHYNLPSSSSDFLHRSGRAARGQRFGKTLSFITQFDQDLLKALESKLSIEFKEFKKDSEKVVLKGMSNIDKIKRKVKVKYLASPYFERFNKIKKQRRVHKQKIE
jgi:superfamily II DNA/RNA helicase